MWGLRKLKSRVLRFLLGLALLASAYCLVFMALMMWEGNYQEATPITAVYWVVCTMTTVGYGDVVFKSAEGRIFSTLVVLSGVAIFFAVALPIIVTPWVERLEQTMPSKAPNDMRDHVMICGYSPVVETLIEKLDRLRIPFLVVEQRWDVARRIRQKYPLVYGDPSERQVLENSHIHSCQLIILNYNDEANADILLTVREMSNKEVIVMVEDLSRSRFLSYAGASRVISPKTLLGTFLAQITSPPREGVFPGSVQLFGNLLLVELPVFPGSPLAKESLNDPRISASGARVVGLWQRGRFCPRPRPDEQIRKNSVLLAVGDSEQLSRLRKETISLPAQGKLLVIGYGDVGRRVVRVLCDWGIDPVVVDRRDIEQPGFSFILGDGTDEELLEKAGIKDAVGVLIMLNHDPDVIYSTLIARNLNPEAFIVARANQAPSATKIYRAGADYVASVPLVASHMLFKMIQGLGEELTILFEGRELIKLEVGRSSPIAGQSLHEADLFGRFRTTVLAIDRQGEVISQVDGRTMIYPGDILAVTGNQASLESLTRWLRQGRLSKIRHGDMRITVPTRPDLKD
ncbi:MAG: Calcium-gated potassium channel MthK [Methanosaeta sp. PtaB.Bin039]|nr:MAG: Calcium-gated potassium channel MthK [Methanosaeta sp. PtaB.Bin039]